MLHNSHQRPYSLLDQPGRSTAVNTPNEHYKSSEAILATSPIIPMMVGAIALASLVLNSLVLSTYAQLTGRVGPTTPLSSKSRICNVFDYGGYIGSSDIGPAIIRAFNVRLLLSLGILFSCHSHSGMCLAKHWNHSLRSRWSVPIASPANRVLFRS